MPNNELHHGYTLTSLFIEAKYAKGRADMLRQFADTETVVRMVQPMHERGEKE